ncbi:MFS transporter [Rhodococcus qingshengii]|uniref:MFS transporter n=1 Tax=Rhodococcus qingshengii TaxID=334542 RepID=UPI0036467871
MLQETGNAGWFFVLLMIQGVGALVALPFCGAIVDARDPARMHAYCSLARVLLVGGAVLVAFTAPSVALFGGVMFALACVDGLQRTSLFGAIHEYVPPPNQRTLIGLFGTAIQGGTVLGMIMLGLFLSFADVRYALIVDAGGAAAAAVIMFALSTGTSTSPERAASRPMGRAFREWLASIAALRTRRSLALLLALCAGDFVFSYGLTASIPSAVETVFAGEHAWISGLEIAFAIAIALGALLTSRLATRRFFLAYLALQAVAALILAVTASPAITVVCFALCGFANVQSLTLLSVTVHGEAGAQEMGRVSALRFIAIALAQVIVMPIMALAASQTLSMLYWGWPW